MIPQFAVITLLSTNMPVRIVVVTATMLDAPKPRYRPDRAFRSRPLSQRADREFRHFGVPSRAADYSAQSREVLRVSFFVVTRSSIELRDSWPREFSRQYARLHFDAQHA